jgi:hypothetical protein
MLGESPVTSFVETQLCGTACSAQGGGRKKMEDPGSEQSNFYFSQKIESGLSSAMAPCLLKGADDG